MTHATALSGTFPAIGDVAGHPVVMHYGDSAREYAALRSGAMLVDRSARGRLRLSGSKAAEMLTGLVTNDVQSLAPGQGMYAAALSPKGKIVADIRIFCDSDGVLTDAPPRATVGWITMVRKYVNPRLAPYREPTETRVLGLFGPKARAIAEALIGPQAESLAALAPYAHFNAVVGGENAMIARVPDLEIEGYEFFVTERVFVDAWQRLTSAGATPAGLLAWEIARIEAGRPEWGLDIDDSTIPQEANFDELHAISYTKGCYVGQEVVARVHFRGHVNKHLRGLLCGHTDPPPAKAELFDDAGKHVGDVRSTALSPRLGAIALATARREIEPGTTLTVRWPEGDARADLLHLPFPL
ncbi:MAG: folate-binding protein YgfZ [Gemmatimonadaceae bacterium]